MDKILKNVNVHLRENDDSLYVVLSNKCFLKSFGNCIFVEGAKLDKVRKVQQKGEKINSARLVFNSKSAEFNSAPS